MILEIAFFFCHFHWLIVLWIFRLPFERTTRLMVILGLTSLMLMQDPERIDGERMVLPVFLTIINVYALVCLSGTGKILFLKNAYSVSLTTKETMART